MSVPPSLGDELTSLLERHTDQDQLYDTAVPGLLLMRVSRRSQPLYASQWPCLAVVAQGAKSLQAGEEELRYGPGQYLLASVDLPIISRVLEASPEKPLLGLAVKIEAEELRQVMRRIDDVSHSSSEGLGVAVHDAETPLLEAVVRLVRLLDSPQDARALAPVFQQEILYRLLTGPCAGRLLQMGRLDSPSNRIAGAMARLRESFERPFKVEDLAREAGMSASSFHQHFKSLYRMSPIQYQKYLRLHEARRLLLVESRAVGEAGFQVGYQSPSQFTKDYRRYFGVTPRSDLSAMEEGQSWSLDTYTPLESTG